MSAWANPNNDIIEPGFLLQYIRKTPEKMIVEDLLLDRQPLRVKSNVWYTVVLEIVEDEALFRMGDHVAYARADSDSRAEAPRLADTWNEIKRVRIRETKANVSWKASNDAILTPREPFAPQGLG